MKWIKLATNLFEDDKLLLLEQLDRGPMLQLLWVKLLCLVGKQEGNGVLQINDTMPYTPKMLATVLRVDLPLVKQGLELFTRFGMLTHRDGVYSVTNWERHQSVTAYENKLRYDREYHTRKSPRKKEKASSFLELTEEEL